MSWQTLCDVVFVEAKCAAGLSYDLVADYLAVTSHTATHGLVAEDDWERAARRPAWIPPVTVRASVETHIKEWQRFVQGTAHLLHRRPRLAFSAAVSQPKASSVHKMGAFPVVAAPVVGWVGEWAG